MSRFRFFSPTGHHIHLRPNQFGWSGWLNKHIVALSTPYQARYPQHFCHVENFKRKQGWKFLEKIDPNCPHNEKK